MCNIIFFNASGKSNVAADVLSSKSYGKRNILIENGSLTEEQLRHAFVFTVL